MKHRKNTYRILLLLVFIGVNILILFGIGQLFSYLNTGADRTSILHVTSPDAKVYLPKVIWENTNNPGRPIEKQSLASIQSDYLKAWYVKNIAYKNNAPYGIDDYYTQHARINILNHISDQKEKEITIESTTLNHNLSLDFYSLDGQLAILTDNNSRQYQRIFKQDSLLLETQTIASYKVVLLLEDGFWKIRHIVKQSNEPLVETTKPTPISSVKNGQVFFENTPFQIKGINYYPQATPWDMFGDHFNTTIIAKDFDIIKKAHLNSIRIFVDYDDFGKAEVIPEKLNKLEQVLDLARVKDLKVIVTLFDFYGNYDVLDWTLTHRHAEQLISRFKNHKAVLAWDIKNEPDLDFKTRNKTNVLAWLKEMATQIKTYDPNHLVTIGWSNTKVAHLLQKNVDVVSFHYYEDIDKFEKKYTDLQSKTSKPLVLQEFGLSSNKGLWNPFGPSEKTQAEYYTTFKEMLDQQNVHYLPWTLYDFTQIPTSVVGKLPWRKHKQKHFGFIDANGSSKKAFQFFEE